MNGSVSLEHSRLWAERLLSRADLSDAERVGLAYQEAFARPVNPSELDRALTFIHEIERVIEDKPDGAERRAKGWESFCRGLFGSSEFIYLD
jgi:hypothetical protein